MHIYRKANFKNIMHKLLSYHVHNDANIMQQKAFNAYFRGCQVGYTVEYNVPQPISLKKLAWVYVIEITCLASYYIYQDRKISAEIKALRIRETILKAFNNFGIFVPVPVKDKPGPQQPQ